ncbi:MAG: eukaryotic-like serine/threonine-protein kinase [Acidobacteriota bacterium]|jgi:serine/threonine protein kinase|nr:eukaryotic-like serine/threonine-protein kinase [Acidobacteriota bacterium]
MSPERWQQVEEVLHGALERAPQERAAYLEEVCAGDMELKDEAAQLLTAHDEAGDFLEQPAIATDARVLISDEMNANIGRVVGPYRIVRELGVGGMGEVYLAQDARLGRLVALKILRSFFAADDTRLRRFQREARAASALNHPNILTIYEVGEADNVHFISTEFIDGQTLRELIPQASLSLAEILDIIVQVASALEAAHAAGIIHRDIKPENIMRRADRVVKILDFGIAKLTESSTSEFSSEAPTMIKTQTETGIVMGTPRYMSPEQARGLLVDERTDIWSLGCVLYEMLSGSAPFAGATRVDTLVALLEREPQPLFESAKDAPAELQQLQRIVSKALRKERDERYRTVTEMLADLKSVNREIALMPAAPVANHPAASPISSLAQQETRQAKRHILQALLIIVLLIAVVFFYSRSAARREANLANATVATKLYTRMSEAEQLAFIHEQEQKISAQMGERPARLNEDALSAIKKNVDAYVARLGSISTEPGREDLRAVYARAAPYLPLIARSFAARKVPVMVGIYLPMIESEYKPCFENQFGAKGLFQFLPQTAKQYGVPQDEMCDVEKMTPAAAHYIADRMAELGDDAESMTLVLLSYNRGPEWVRNTLRQLRDSDAGNYERNFWTLFINRDKLDDHFRTENADYVPRFFAAAIIGENPQTFGLQTPPLKALAEASVANKP